MLSVAQRYARREKAVKKDVWCGMRGEAIQDDVGIWPVRRGLGRSTGVQVILDRDDGRKEGRNCLETTVITWGCRIWLMVATCTVDRQSAVFPFSTCIYKSVFGKQGVLTWLVVDIAMTGQATGKYAYLYRLCVRIRI